MRLKYILQLHIVEITSVNIAITYDQQLEHAWYHMVQFGMFLVGVHVYINKKNPTNWV